MVRTKVSDKVEGIVVCLSKTKHSYRSVMKVVKDLGFSFALRCAQMTTLILKMAYNEM